jgi:hypothetical protein
MSEYTPGPWAVVELVDGYDIRAPEADCYIATASDPEAVWGAIGPEEDACLIAAAPELLEALEELFHLIDSAHDGERVFTFKMQRKAKAAIAKAKGE